MDPEKLTIELGAQTKRAEDAEKRADEAEKKLRETLGTLEGHRARADALDTDAKELVRLRGEVETLTEKLKASEKARADAEDPEKLKVAVRSRVKIESAARTLLGDATRFDDFSDRQLMAAVIEKMPRVYGGGELKQDASDETIRCRFDLCIDTFEAGERGKQRLREVSPRTEERHDARTPREVFIARQTARGLEPLPRRKEI